MSPSSTTPPQTSALSRDMVWNLVSFGFIAAAGMFTHIFIARAYGPAALGAFNQAVALYIFLSQISTAGIHLAILQRVSVLAEPAVVTANAHQLRSIISISVFNVAVISLVVVVLGYALSNALAAVFDSRDVGIAWLCILPGLWFFSLNKLLLNVMNGLRHMRAFAVAQASRYLLMLAILLGFALLAVDSRKLTLIVTLSEAVLFVALAAYVYRLYPPSLRLFDRALARDQLVFGLRGMWGNALTDLNARVDVIVLGIFTDDRIVGIYTMVATIFDGLYQCLIVLRNVFNPRIAALFASGRIEELKASFRRIALLAYAGTLVLAILAVASYPLLIDWIVRDPSFHEGFWPLVILATGLWLVSGWLSLDMLLLQAGDPTAQSFLKAITVATNILLAIAFVPRFGMVAAAAASATSLVLSIVWLKLLVRYRLGMKL